MCRQLAEALKKLEAVEDVEFPGTYQKRIGPLFCPTVELKGTANDHRIWLWASSGTQSLGVPLDREQARTTLQILQEAPTKGDRLVETLEAMT